MKWMLTKFSQSKSVSLQNCELNLVRLFLYWISKSIDGVFLFDFQFVYLKRLTDTLNRTRSTIPLLHYYGKNSKKISFKIDLRFSNVKICQNVMNWIVLSYFVKSLNKALKDRKANSVLTQYLQKYYLQKIKESGFPLMKFYWSQKGDVI